MKITFVIGPSGVGKSSYIEREYSDKEQVCIFNIARKAKELFGSYDAMEDGEKELEAINQSSNEAFFALMEGDAVVVEYLADGFDDGLFALIKKAKSLGIRTEIITLTLDSESAWERVQKADSDYFPSAKIKEDTEMVLMNVLEDVEFNLDFERVCEVGGEGGSINFYRCKKADKDCYFFTTDESGFFDFKPELEFEQIEGVNYLEEFSDFSEAFERLLEKYPIFRLFPLDVNPKYKREFKEAYQKFLGLEEPGFENHSWDQYLN